MNGGSGYNENRISKGGADVDKKNMIKKLVGLFVCLILVASAGLMTLRSCDGTAGAGGGVDGNITSLESFHEMLQVFSSRVSFLSEPSFDGDSHTHHSVTIHVNLSTYKREKFYGESSSLQHTAIVYLAEREALYVFDSTYSAAGRNTYVAMQLYKSSERQYLKFDRIVCANAGERVVFPEAFLGRWIDLSEIDLDEILSSLSIIDNKFFKTLSAVEAVVSETQEGNTEQKNLRYTYNRDAISLFGLKILELEGIETTSVKETMGAKNPFEGSFEIDLSRASRPQAEFFLEAERTSLDRDSKVPLSYFYVITTGEFSFSRLDNTAIHMPKNVNAVGKKEYSAFMEACK